MLLAPDPSDYGCMSGRLGHRLDRAGGLLLPAVAVALAVVLLAALATAALRSSTASAATVLHRGDGVTAVLAGGERVALSAGDEVPRGATVTAGRSGAVLRTRDRDTWLSAGAAVRVVDGARQELRAGFVMVDARQGPALDVDTPAAAVRTPAGTVSRVESGALLRVGTYTGDPVTVRAAGRRAEEQVRRAYQVQVPDGGLPGAPTPLALTPGDRYERALAADLVMADEALTVLAGRLDTGRPAQVVTAALTAEVAEPPGAAPAGSERALAYLLARALDGDVAADYAEVAALRAAGGSWGVVAAIVGAEVDRVAALLDALLAPAEAVLAGDEIDLDQVVGAITGTPSTPSSPSSAEPAGTGRTPPDPQAGPGPADDPAGPDDPEEPPSLTEPVDAVVDTVLGLLPDSPLSGPAPTSPTVPPLPGDPTPSPSPSSGGLLSGVTGSLGVG